jgi:hypothetical protein
MGGNAFPNLKVPRLSHELYNTLLVKCMFVLYDTFYKRVTTPPEGPSKSDHGDIDFIVCNPTHDFNVEELSSALGAVKHTKVGVTTSFAIPLPEEHAPAEKGEGERASTKQEYAQVDVHVCPAEYYEWELLLGSYGDLMQVIGVLNRAVGLTANNIGLHIRIPEIEVYNRKQSMLYLTHSITEVMEFLGLGYMRYLHGFETDEEVFEWCVSGRFYGPAAQGKENESARDRQRYVKRRMFTTCMNEWLPAHPEVWEGRRVWTREEVLDEAIRFFKREDEYAAMLATHREKAAEEQLLVEIKAAIGDEADAVSIGEAMKGLKRFVAWEDGHAVWREGAREEDGDKPRWTSLVKEEEREGLLEWVKVNWEEAGRKERERRSLMK